MRSPKYDLVADKLTEEIISGTLKMGEVIPSQSLLVEKYKVSRSCIQKAIDLLDERGLIARKPGKGIYVKDKNAEKRAEGRVKSIAYLINMEQKNFSNDYDNFGLELLWGIEEKARELGLNFLLRRQMPTDCDSIISTIRDFDVDGIILHKYTDKNTLTLIANYGIPAVMTGEIIHSSKISGVALNIVDSYRILLSRLEESCDKVCIMYSSGYFWNDDFEALKQIALNYEDMEIVFVDWFEVGTPINSLAEDAHFKSCLSEIIKDDILPDVFVCMSDWYAMKAIGILNENKISVPDDTGVIGTLGLALSESFSPSITTLAVNPAVIGHKSCEILSKMIRGESSSVIERIPLSIIERESFIFTNTVAR